MNWDFSLVSQKTVASRSSGDRSRCPHPLCPIEIGPPRTLAPLAEERTCLVVCARCLRCIFPSHPQIPQLVSPHVTPATRGLRIPQLLHPPSSARRHIAKYSIHHPSSPTRRRPFTPESRGITTSCNCSFHLFLFNYTLSPYSASNTLVPFYLGCLWGLVGSSITRPPEAFLLSAPLLSSPCPDLTSPPTPTTTTYTRSTASYS